MHRQNQKLIPNAEEHHLSNFDAGAFFTLHDFDSNGDWNIDEINRMYGLLSEESANIPEDKKAAVAPEVLRLFDENKNGVVEREEFINKSNFQGVRLPDFGLGPGHHGDDEYEYEIHHFEKFHGEGEFLTFLFPPLSPSGWSGYAMTLFLFLFFSVKVIRLTFHV
jgi:hypothetical protein